MSAHAPEAEAGGGAFGATTKPKHDAIVTCPDVT
jgi:hypothetical protein